MKMCELAGSERRRWGAVLSYVNAVVSMVVGLLYVPILLSGIGREEYGLYQLVGSMLGYMTLLNGILSSGTTRYFCTAYATGDINEMQRVLATCTYMYRRMTLAVICVAAVAVGVFPAVYRGSLSAHQVFECQIMLIILVVNLVITMTNSVYVAVINAHERFAFLKLTSLANSILQPVLIIVVVQFAPYSVSIVSVMLFLNVIVAFLQNHYAKQLLGSRIDRSASNRHLARSISAFVCGLLFASLADQIFWRTNQLVIGFYFGAAEVAVYGVGAQIYTSYLSLGNVVTSVFMPRVSELFAGGRIDLISDLFIKVGRLSLYVLVGIYGGFVIFGKDFITLWAGRDYLDAYYIALAIMAAFMLDSSQSLGITVLQVANRYKFRAMVYFVLACIDFVLVFLLAPYVGEIGCAVITALMMIVANGPVMNVFYAKQMRMDVRGFWRNAVRLIAPLVALIVGCWMVWNVLPAHGGWLQLIAAGLLYVVLFGVIAWLFCANDYERGLLNGFARKLRKSRC